MQPPTQHPAHIIRRVQGGIILLFGFLLLGVLVLSFGVYGFAWEDRNTLAVTKLVPLPAATVGWRPLRYSSYLIQRTALRVYNAREATATGGVYTQLSEPEVQRTAVRKILRDAATNILLERYGIALRPADIDQAFSAQVLQSGNRQSTTDAIRELYDWTPQQYKQYVISTAVAREKLREYLSFHSTSSSAERQANEVLKLVKAGDESFGDLARKYSDDAYGANGGDLGLVAAGEQAEEIDRIAFTLEVGAVSEVIHTKYGYHIITVTEKKQEDGQDKVHLLQIFIAGPSVDEAITKELQAQPVVVWLRAWRWDHNRGDVVPR